MYNTTRQQNKPKDEPGIPVYKPINIQTMLEAGTHFGHKTAQWNPKMAQYLYGSRNDVYIFNLERTFDMWQDARKIIVDTISEGKSILLVGAKKQCREVLAREAKRCGAYYVSHKWVGGLLTNFKTVKASIKKMKDLRTFLAKADEEDSGITVTKKEKLERSRDLDKLEKQFGGIEGMISMPDLIFVVDVNKHHIAVAEAKMAKIPVMALVDSNANPDIVDYIIPANDDSNGSLALFITNVADAVLEGRELREQALNGQTEEEVEIESEEKQFKAKQEVPRESKKPRRKKGRGKKAGGYPDKREIADGVTFYTQERYEKETK